MSNRPMQGDDGAYLPGGFPAADAAYEPIKIAPEVHEIHGPKVIGCRVVVYAKGPMSTEQIALEVDAISYEYDLGGGLMSIVAEGVDKDPKVRVTHLFPKGTWTRAEIRNTYDRDLA